MLLQKIVVKHIKKLNLPYDIVKIKGAKDWYVKDYNIDNKESIYVPEGDITYIHETSISEILLYTNRRIYWSPLLNEFYKEAKTQYQKNKIIDTLEIRKSGVHVKLSFVLNKKKIETNNVIRITHNKEEDEQHNE